MNRRAGYDDCTDATPSRVELDSPFVVSFWANSMLNPLTAILSAPAALAAVDAATRTVGDAASSFAGALADVLDRTGATPDAEPSDATSDHAADLQSLAEELQFEWTQLLEAAGISLDESPRFRVSAIDGQIEIVAEDSALSSALEDKLASRPEFIDLLQSAATRIGALSPQSKSIEFSLDADGRLAIDAA
jgi:hypothetical protein